MLARVLREIPKLTDAVVGADVRRRADLRRDEHRRGRCGSRDRARASSGPPARPARSRASPAPRDRSRAPWRPSSDLAIGRYDALTADEIVGRLTGLSQVDLAKVAAYERKHENRSTVLGRIDSLQGNEPWPGYDELTADEVRAVLAEADDDRIERGPRVRARPQEPRRRPQGRRARGGHRLARGRMRGAASAAAPRRGLV